MHPQAAGCPTLSLLTGACTLRGIDALRRVVLQDQSFAQLPLERNRHNASCITTAVLQVRRADKGLTATLPSCES
jgi:hypothetical protein